jgi:glycosyltransferase involved in cell wall biosynthesis
MERATMTTTVALIENNILATYTIREKLTRELMAKGYNVVVLTSGNPEQFQIAKEKGFNFIDIGQSTQDPRDIFRYLMTLYRTLKQLRPQICLTFTIRPAIWGNIITRVLTIPTVTNITGIGPLFTRNDIAYRGARLLYKFVLKKTSKIFFQNYDDMNVFLQKKFVHPSVVERIPGSGIDYEHYAPRAKKQQDGKFKFIFIGRLIKDKGILEYVEAAKKLKVQFPDIEFQALGPIWKQNLKDNTVSEAEVQQWVEAGVINYLGESKDIRSFLAEADCLVLPSYREGMSNVLLEASSMEKPCVTTDTTGCRDIVEEGVTGYLCKVQDIGDLASKMAKIYSLTEEKRSLMGKKAREKVIKEFDKKIVINAYVRAIEQRVSQNLNSFLSSNVGTMIGKNNG